MKLKVCITTLLLATSFGFGFSADLTKLAEVNANWNTQLDAYKVQNNSIQTNVSYHELIRTHLLMLGDVLEMRSVSHLSTQQQENRRQMLQVLQDYAYAGAFPQNVYLPYKNPVFIDGFRNFCAVGHLLKSSGYQALAEKIATEGNFRYVKDINEPELLAWAGDYGFTTEELAWIQPAYQASYHSMSSAANGLPGTVKECYLTAFGYSGRMLAVGDFSFNDETTAGEIKGIGAYDFQSGYWQPLAEGINGTVNCLAITDTFIYAGGSFSMAGIMTASNVASWNGTSWTPLGHLNGPVYCMEYYNGALYAAGVFSSTTPGNAFMNFARWNGSEWESAGISFNDTVFTMEIINGKLLIGGKFTHCGNFPVNYLVSFDGTAAYPLGTGPSGPVRALTLYQGKIHAGGDFFYNAQYFGLQSYDEQLAYWTSVFNPSEFSFNYAVYNYKINTLAVINDPITQSSDLLIGGDFVFNYQYSMFFPSRNMVRLVNNQYYIAENDYNGAVNSISVVGENYCVGGDFTADGNGPLNHIGFSTLNPTAIDDVPEKESNILMYPNPSQGMVTISLKNNEELSSIELVNAGGQLAGIIWANLAGQPVLQTEGLSPGIYTVRCSSKSGNQYQQKLVVK